MNRCHVTQSRALQRYKSMMEFDLNVITLICYISTSIESQIVNTYVRSSQINRIKHNIKKGNHNEKKLNVTKACRNTMDRAGRNKLYNANKLQLMHINIMK